MRKRSLKISRRTIGILAGGLATAAAAFGLWYWLRPRSIDVCVISDYSFRQQHDDWYERLVRRFDEVNRIFAGTGVHWRFFHANEPDPTRTLHGMELRRQKLSRAECRADIILEVSGNPESTAAGDVAPFAHTAIVVDDPKASEPQNVLRLAHGMATLFGVPTDPAGAGTVMTEPPESAKLPPRDSWLISRLRSYDFREGTLGLVGEWGNRALHALTNTYSGRSGTPAAEAHRVFGMAFAADEYYAPAIAHLREVTRLNPGNPEAYVDLANVLQHNFEYKEAIVQYREAEKWTPQSPEIHSALGLALASAGLGQNAIDEFTEALRLRPDFAVAQAGLAYVLSQQLGRVDEAIAAYHTALGMNPQLPQARDGLAQAEAAKEAAADRVPDRRKRAQEHPNEALAHVDLGVEQARAGQLEGAVQALRRAVELNPGIGRAHADLALLLYLRKDYPAAWHEAQAAQKNGFTPPADLQAILQAKAVEAR
jgi:Flp pilus assembly protein TadD